MLRRASPLLLLTIGGCLAAREPVETTPDTGSVPVVDSTTPPSTPTPTADSGTPVPGPPPCTKAGSTYQISTGDVFRCVPAGSFFMGSPQSEPGHDDDETLHEVTIDAVWILETEVTQALWTAVMGSNPSYHTDCGDDCPVDGVAWFETALFANRLSDMEGVDRAYEVNIADETVTWNQEMRGFRLLTEAEFERAARANDGTRYSGSDDPDEAGWYRDNTDPDGPRPSCTKARNGWGFCDMSGNQWEWLWDWYAVEYPTEAVVNPTGPETGANRCLRGGYWHSFTDSMRVANRWGNFPNLVYGLRIAISAPPAQAQALR